MAACRRLGSVSGLGRRADKARSMRACHPFSVSLKASCAGTLPMAAGASMGNLVHIAGSFGPRAIRPGTDTALEHLHGNTRFHHTRLLALLLMTPLVVHERHLGCHRTFESRPAQRNAQRLD